MSYDDGGLKLTIKEKTSKEEILNNLAMILTYLETTHGIEEFSNINIYLQMYKDDERQILVDPTYPTKKFGGFLLKPETNHKIFQALPDGSKKVVYKKDVNFQRIEQTINSLIQMPEISEYKSICVKQIEEEKRKHKIYLEEKRKQDQEAYSKKLAERKKIEQEDKDFLLSFKRMIADKLSCEIQELSFYTTSMNFVTGNKTMLKYLGSVEVPKEEKIFKVTYKDKISKKASFSEVYDLNKNLLNLIQLNKE